MELELFNDLFEGRMIRSRNDIGKLNARDVADLTFLHIIALTILSNEFSTSDFAQRYAKRTMQYNNFDRMVTSSTDLYMLLHLIMGKNAEDSREYLKDDRNNEILFDRMSNMPSLTYMRRFFTNIATNKEDTSFTSRLLLKLQSALVIQNSNYRSVRVLAANWGDITEHQKRLVMTRLLQAFRIRARRSELMPILDNLAKRRNYELENVANPEEDRVNKDKRSGASAWKKLAAAGLGAAAGGYGAYRLLRNPNINQKGK